jgi:uncharacterized protein (UPF0261 family)
MGVSAGVLLVASMDTKGQEAQYVKECLEEEGIRVLLLDWGIRGTSRGAGDVTPEEVAKAGGKPLAQVQALGHEGKALEVMITGAVACAEALFDEGRVRGVIGLGGSMGTSVGSAVMRSLPLGIPKVMISTMASRNTRPFVGTRDILMLHSVCDLSGLNSISRRILRNGSMALAGMMKGFEEVETESKPFVALSTLGTTDACAQRVRRKLEEKGKEVVVFHTVGSGGAALEEMVREEAVEAVVEISLHEIADHLLGGDYDAGPDRGSAALQKGIPTVLVPGNLDFLVTGPLANAQKLFPKRRYHVHNPSITVVRTESKEMVILVHALAKLCHQAKGPVAILVPLGGFSAFDVERGPLYDPEAPKLFGQALKRELRGKVPLHLLPLHINDPEFADAVVQALEDLSAPLLKRK